MPGLCQISTYSQHSGDDKSCVLSPGHLFLIYGGVLYGSDVSQQSIKATYQWNAMLEWRASAFTQQVLGTAESFMQHRASILLSVCVCVSVFSDLLCPRLSQRFRGSKGKKNKPRTRITESWYKSQKLKSLCTVTNKTHLQGQMISDW